jgi:hypothetical protein
MIGDLITCGLHHLPGPFRDITKVQFDDMTACFTDNMVMVILQLTEFIPNSRTIYKFEDNSHGLEQIERSIDGSQPNPSLFFTEALIKLLGAHGTNCIE